MNALDLSAFETTPLRTDPYEHVIVPGFVRSEALAAIRDAFPRVGKPGSFPVCELAYGDAFADLLDDLDGVGFEAFVADKFGIDLSGRAKLFTVRGRCQAKDGRIHTDSLTKIITVLIYLNPGWEADAGRLRVLRGPEDLDDYAAEIPPLAGTLFAFRRSDRSYHGHEQYEGERRAIQVNWMTDARTRDREIVRHRVSARIKRLNPFG